MSMSIHMSVYMYMSMYVYSNACTLCPKPQSRHLQDSAPQFRISEAYPPRPNPNT